jgi:hypothetical protein
MNVVRSKLTVVVHTACRCGHFSRYCTTAAAHDKRLRKIENCISHTNSAERESELALAPRDLTHACAMSFSLMRVSSSSQPIVEGWVVCDP